MQLAVDGSRSLISLAGSPRLAILGREVTFVSYARADLVAVELETGRVVIIEIKLAANSDRRHVLAQVLEYAAYLRVWTQPV